MSDIKPVFEIRNNQGTAHLNKSKTEDWHAKYSGKCRINEVLYYFTINPKISANGNEYMEFKLGKAIDAAPAAKPNFPDVPDF